MSAALKLSIMRSLETIAKRLPMTPLAHWRKLTVQSLPPVMTQLAIDRP